MRLEAGRALPARLRMVLLGATDEVREAALRL
jgi:hypothetical protein